MSDPIYAGWTKRQWAKHDRVEGDILAALKHYRQIYGDEKTVEIVRDMLDFLRRLNAKREELAASQRTEVNRG